MNDSLLQLPLEHGDFLNIDLTQCSVATCLRWGGVFKNNFITNLLYIESNSKRILKIDQHLAKYADKSIVSCFFLIHSVDNGKKRPYLTAKQLRIGT